MIIRKPGPSGWIPTIVAPHVIITATISARSGRAEAGTSSKHMKAPTYTTRTTLTARLSPWMPGAGWARKVTTTRSARASTPNGKLKRKSAATLGALSDVLTSIRAPEPIGMSVGRPGRWLSRKGQ